jgi:hypothetical protein
MIVSDKKRSESGVRGLLNQWRALWGVDLLEEGEFKVGSGLEI